MFTPSRIKFCRHRLIICLLASIFAADMTLATVHAETRPTTRDPFTADDDPAPPPAPAPTPAPAKTKLTPAPTPTKTNPTISDFLASPNDPALPPIVPNAAPIAPQNLRIPINGREKITFGPTGCPVIVIGQSVWSTRTGTVRARLEGKPEDYDHRVLSNNGKYFAAAQKRDNTSVTVWSTETGKRLLEVPGASGRRASVMMFSRDKYLILGNEREVDLQAWDVEQKELITTIDAQSKDMKRGNVAYSADGEHFISTVGRKPALFKTVDTTVVSIMTTPRKMDPSAPRSSGTQPVASSPSPPGNLRVKTPASPASADDLEVYGKMWDMQFSPDGREIAAISTHPVNRLIAWDSAGKVLFDEPILVPLDRAQLQWLPDKSGWLVNSHIIDRDTQRPVFGIQRRDVAFHAWMLDNDHLLSNAPSHWEQLRCFTVPWKQIRRSLELMKDPNAALLSPLKPVSITCDPGNVPGGAATTSPLIEAIRNRLLRDGITVRDGGDVVFAMKLSDQADQTLPIYENRQDTGRTATLRRGTLVVEVNVKGQDSPLWRNTIQGISSARYDDGVINETTIRQSMINVLARQFHELPLPYFIPKDKKELALPVFVE